MAFDGTTAWVVNHRDRSLWEIDTLVPGRPPTVVTRPRGRTDVHGLLTDGDGVWLADTTNGYVYRFANPELSRARNPRHNGLPLACRPTSVSTAFRDRAFRETDHLPRPGAGTRAR